MTSLFGISVTSRVFIITAEYRSKEIQSSVAQLQSVAYFLQVSVSVCVCVSESDWQTLNEQESLLKINVNVWLDFFYMTGFSTATLEPVPCVVAEAHSLLARERVGALLRSWWVLRVHGVF